MNNQNDKQKQDLLGQPSEAPLKNEPTPERANQEKEKQEKQAERKQ